MLRHGQLLYPLHWHLNEAPTQEAQCTQQTSRPQHGGGST